MVCWLVPKMGSIWLFHVIFKGWWAIVWVHFQLHDFTTRQQRCTKIVKPEDAVVSFPIDDLHVGCSDLKCWIRWLQVDKRTQKLNKQGSEAKEKILAKYQKKTSTRTSPKGDLLCWKIGAGNASKNLGNLPGDWDDDGALAKWQRCHNTTLLEMMVKHAKCKDM
jgi:hypothetical protein